MNKLETKLLKHYIGYEQPRDEYQQGVINETLTTANLYTFYLLTICMVISLILILLIISLPLELLLCFLFNSLIVIMF